MIYVVMSIFALHFISLPLVIGVKIDIDTEKEYGSISIKLLFIPIYKKKIGSQNIKRFVKEKTENNHSDGEKKDSAGKRSAFKKYLIRFGLKAARRVRVRDADLKAKVGMDDAALTACTVGSALIAYDTLCAYFGIVPSHDSITPDYDKPILFVRFFGIFSLCIGDIIYAAFAALKSGKRGIGGKYGRVVVNRRI